MDKNKVIGWSVYEDIAIAIVNPRGVAKASRSMFDPKSYYLCG